MNNVTYLIADSSDPFGCLVRGEGEVAFTDHETLDVRSLGKSAIVFLNLHDFLFILYIGNIFKDELVSLCLCVCAHLL